jgi:hypothetical protein
MIGIRGAASAGAAVLGLVLVLGPRTADPSVGIAAERLIRERAVAASSALEDLRAAVEPGLDAARGAAASVLSGDEPPSPRIEAAAALIADAERFVAPALQAVTELAAARVAWRPDAIPLREPVAAGELASIAAQLAAAGPATDSFADTRIRATGLAGLLEEAVLALERGDLDEASDLTSRARADHDAVLAWETDLATLPVWIETTDAMIGAVEGILVATRAGNAAVADEAAAAFAALADEAPTADRALRIALGEGGSSLTAAPLERLATGVRDIEASRAAVDALLAEPDR